MPPCYLIYIVYSCKVDSAIPNLEQSLMLAQTIELI